MASGVHEGHSNRRVRVDKFTVYYRGVDVIGDSVKQVKKSLIDCTG